MTIAERAEVCAQRAEAADKTQVDYALGTGAKKAKAKVPWTMRNGRRKCDCSAFDCWCAGVDKLDDSGLWYGTDRMFYDATHDWKRFRQIETPIRGCLVVYPKAGKGTWGHCGVVTNPATRETIDCASTPWKKGGDAITKSLDKHCFWALDSRAIFIVPVAWGM